MLSLIYILCSISELVFAYIEGCYFELPCVEPSSACLTPELGTSTDNPNRPVIQLVNKTNTSITVNWTVPQLTADCQESVFSSPPLHYTLEAEANMYDLPGFPMVGLV